MYFSIRNNKIIKFILFHTPILKIALDIRIGASKYELLRRIRTPSHDEFLSYKLYTQLSRQTVQAF